MKNFELTFRTEFDDGYSAGNGGPFTRVIATDETRLAIDIAQGMVGEEVGYHLWLAEALSVQETGKAPSLSALTDDTLVWKRVFQRLKVTDLRQVCFVYRYGDALLRVRFHDASHAFPPDQPDIVGFYLQPPKP